MSSPRIYSCRAWGARPVAETFPLRRAEGIVVHHTTSPNRTPLTGDAEVRKAFALARSMQQSHLDRGWADTGNHFTITRGGVLLEGRHGSLAAALKGQVPRGAHAGDSEANATWIGVEWEGRYDRRYLVTPVQWEAAVQVFAWLAFWGKFDTQNIQPHSQFKETACPGLLRDRIPELQKAVHDRKVAIIATQGGKG